MNSVAHKEDQEKYRESNKESEIFKSMKRVVVSESCISFKK